jgi:class 3 adenylate cyclase/CHASE2 domain-containing sensor protein
MKWSRLQYLLLITVGAAVVAQLAWAGSGVTGLERLELLTLDLRQRAAADQLKLTEGDTEVVIVFFDTASVNAWHYRSPFPRSHLADLIDALSFAGARTIGVDVFLEKRFPMLNQWDGGDDRLRASIESAGNVVLVSLVEEVDDLPTLVEPDTFFSKVAADVASADLPTPFETQRDGTLAVRSGTGLEPSFALSVFAHSRGIDVDSLLAKGLRQGRISLSGLPKGVGVISRRWWTEDDDGGFAVDFPLRFVGPPSHVVTGEVEIGTFRAISSNSVLGLAYLNSDFFRDKIVLMGTGSHDSDKFRTPFYGTFFRDFLGPDAVLEDEDAQFDYMFGVEIHANAIQNFISGEYIVPLQAGPTWGLLFVASLLAGTLVFWKGAIWGAIAGLLVSVGVYFGAFAAYLGGLPGGLPAYLWIPVITPLLAVWVSYAGSVAYVSIVEGKEKRFIRSAFGKYVSPAVVGEIAEHPESLKLGGQKRPISVLFSDLAGFTTMSEKMEPEELIAHLNEYLTDMTDLVMAEGGTLDKYIGDAIMAFWNAPNEVRDHADRALRCAIFMQRKMQELNARWRDRVESGGETKAMAVRIGVNTGPVVVGNVGGEERFDYSAIGDPVNLGARLEPENKNYGTFTMASEFTMKAADPEGYRVRELDLIAVYGKQEPVKVYEVLEFRGVTFSDEREEALRQYAQGLKVYKTMDWELAAKYFETALEHDPEDGPSRVYLGRCKDNIANPPPADWNFVVRRTVK